MGQADKAALWRELKEAGVEFPLHYREYTTDELLAIRNKLVAENDAGDGEAAPESRHYLPQDLPRSDEADELAGLRQNTHSADEPIRVDSNGLIWYQDEVRKAAFAKPRGRRLLKYRNTGTKSVTVKSGDYTETFEMPGEGRGISEARITLPSHQEGIYRDPKLPFRIYVYNDRRGFDFFEVQAFYGGEDLVPIEIKRVYVGSILCYDIRTTIRAIQSEYRERVLQKGN